MPFKGEIGKDFRITQRYGNNFKVNGKWMYGEIIKLWDKHEGIDMAGPKPGQKIPCYSSVNGIVSELGFDKGWGNYVYIQFDGYEIIYAHLDSIICKLGPIKAFDEVGIIGTTGTSSGTHLHFGLRPIGGKWIDPTSYISNWDIKKNIDDNTKEIYDFNSDRWNKISDEGLKIKLNETNNYIRKFYNI